MSCSVLGRSAPGGGGGGVKFPRPGNVGGGAFGIAARPNIIIAGTGCLASAGVTSTICISTLIAGKDELSTCPVSIFATTGYLPTFVLAVSVTVHVTFGRFFGTRPSTSRSKSSTISGRRCSHHTLAEVTFFPFFNVNASGNCGKGFANDSS